MTNPLLNIGRAPINIVVLTIFLITPLESKAAAPTVTDVHDIADICAQLHKALKDYVLVGMGVKYEAPAEDLKKVIITINKDFAHLLEGNHLGDVTTAKLKSLQKDWKAVETVLKAPPSQEAVIKLHDDINLIAQKCKTLAEQIAEDSKIPGEIYVVISSELLMDIQQLAALYMMAAWQTPPPQYREEAQAILVDFEKHLKKLADADEAYVPQSVKKKLKGIDEEFILFEHMALSKSGRFVPSLAQRTTKSLHEHTLAIANEIVKQVEKD